MGVLRRWRGYGFASENTVSHAFLDFKAYGFRFQCSKIFLSPKPGASPSGAPSGFGEGFGGV